MRSFGRTPFDVGIRIAPSERTEVEIRLGLPSADLIKSLPHIVVIELAHGAAMGKPDGLNCHF
jgi:hypothetical protein